MRLRGAQAAVVLGGMVTGVLVGSVLAFIERELDRPQTVQQWHFMVLLS